MAANESSDKGVEIEVVDQGVGIAKDDMARIFEEFVQVSRIEAAGHRFGAADLEATGSAVGRVFDRAFHARRGQRLPSHPTGLSGGRYGGSPALSAATAA